MKKAIIFGHSSGLGHELSRKLIDDGYEIVGIARTKSDLNSNLLTNISLDMSVKEDVDSAISILKKDHSSFNYLFYCTGTLTAHDIDNIEYEELERLYKINTLSPIVIESSLLALIKKNGADVVNISSSSLIDYYPKYSEYASSKASIQKFTQDLQKELKDTECRVIDFCPSGFSSDLYKKMTGDKIERDNSAQMKAEDLADLMIYLLKLPKKIEISHIFINTK